MIWVPWFSDGRDWELLDEVLQPGRSMDVLFLARTVLDTRTWSRVDGIDSGIADGIDAIKNSIANVVGGVQNGVDD